jgi:hypothetical protein
VSKNFRKGKILDKYLVEILIFIIGLLIGKFLPSYFNKKGENLATKEDIAEITKKAEEVKSEYLKELENFKADLVKQQKGFNERFEWYKKLADVSKKLKNRTKIQKYYMQQNNQEAMNTNVMNELADLAFAFQELSEQSLIYAEKNTHNEIVKVISYMNGLKESFESNHINNFDDKNHPMNLSIQGISTVYDLVSHDLREMMGLEDISE